MRTIIGVSNFSFDVSHFYSFKELDDQFKRFGLLKDEYVLEKVTISVAKDISKDKWFGLSIEEQLKNFEFGEDKGVITQFKLLLDRTYLRGFDRTYTSKELKQNAKKGACLVERTNTILFVPKIYVGGYPYFRIPSEFYDHYEAILGEFPIDSESYYERAISFFDNIIFHGDCRSTLDLVDGNFCDFTISFTKCLRALNDYDSKGVLSTTDRVDQIDKLTAYDCTNQGSSHKNFKFDFEYQGKRIEALDCQYHLKPSDNNKKGDATFYQNRIYFGFFPLSEIEWKIAVAAIGPHINDGSGTRYQKPKKRRKKKKRKGNK
ncbi:hypothetical protein R5E07_000247 [Vibrio vulnificus]|uniref:hypothetical protein n=1 Tax=Vibrio vulnificus TaxID=672 RepID=UPI000735613A|nr:hypothetical protein [Vibrio vulnificus]ELK8507673.1 hypothetical protein [Vibrio vulnificus]ELK8994245.1 hypothetical protein [Vibrio vulnificus]ELS3447535.1 hypothetical protein [Vibrio vulnificus]ELS9097026.1 hypothetical protein [Vibrio vulnificus]MDK2636292.1 hypothetical protein [Vibrio vulnificus]